MAEATTQPMHASAGHGDDGSPRRDFLKLTAAAMAAVGTGAFAWPFISSMNPAADVLALSSTEVDLKPIAVGQAITVIWRGKPVFIRHRTEEEIKEARAVPLSQLPDPQTDQARAQKCAKCPRRSNTLEMIDSVPSTSVYTLMAGMRKKTVFHQ